MSDREGDRTGFQGRRYRTELLSERSFSDDFGDYLPFLRPLLESARRLLAESGTLYVHLDYREAHYVKVALDEIFGRECFLNEIVWAYDYGARAKRRWPAKSSCPPSRVTASSSRVASAGEGTAGGAGRPPARARSGSAASAVAAFP